jgi:hypothetical protein
MADGHCPTAPQDGVLIPLDAEKALRALSEFRRSEERVDAAAELAPVEQVPAR